MENTTNSYRYTFGICLLLGVVVLWVGSNFLVQRIFSAGEFNNAFFLTYFNTGTFSLYLVVAYFQRLYKRSSYARNKKKTRNFSPEDTYEERTSLTASDAALENVADEQLSVKETAKLSLVFCLLWFIANWSNNASLGYTSVASSTILSSTCGIFTLLLGTLFNVENFTPWKLIGVLISVSGVSLIGASDFSATTTGRTVASIILGDFLSLAGAFFYGCYTTFLKYKVGDENRIDMQLFLGFVGLINLVLLFPLFFVLHYTGVEPFVLPPTSTVWGMLLLNAFIGAFISDLMWVYAVVMTSPLVVTLGLSLTNPLALIGDVLINRASVSPLYISGACLVVVGFLVVNRVSFREQTQS